jgi:hypothetical protein
MWKGRLVILETLVVSLQNGSEDLGFDRYVTIDRWLDLIWAVGFDLVVVVACKWMATAACLPSGGGAARAVAGPPASSPAAANRELRCAKTVSKRMEKKRRRREILPGGRRGGGSTRDSGPAAGASGGGGAPRLRLCGEGGEEGRGAGWRGGPDAPL